MLWAAVYQVTQSDFILQKWEPHVWFFLFAKVFLIALPLIGLATAGVQLRIGGSETWRALALLPLAFHLLAIVIVILSLMGGGVVPP